MQSVKPVSAKPTFFFGPSTARTVIFLRIPFVQFYLGNGLYKLLEFNHNRLSIHFNFSDPPEWSTFLVLPGHDL
jgi:hypothetical protein